MGLRAEATGARELGASLEAAADALVDIGRPGRLIASRLEATVDPPVKTGRLASTVRAEQGPTGVTLLAGGPPAPYAAKVHAANPFLIRAVDATASDAVEAVTDHLTTITDTITGA